MTRCVASCGLLLLLLSGYGQSSNLIFKHIDRAAGLPIDEVTCLAQDSTGFIWIGSKEGLFRFDGFSYNAFYHIPDNDQTIPNNYIRKILIDKEGFVWVATSGGVALLKNTGQVVKIWTAETDSLFSNEAENVFDIQQLKEMVWVATGNGLFSMHKTKDHSFSVQRHDLKKEFAYSTNELGSFSIDSRGQLWICTMHGLVMFDPEKSKLIHANNNPQGLKIFNEKKPFRNIYFDETRKLIRYTTWTPAERIFEPVSNKITTVYSGQGAAQPNYSYLVSQYLKDDFGTLWIGSGKGLKIITKNDSAGYILSHQRGNTYSLLDNNVTALLIDKEKTLWVGTSSGITTTQPYRQSLVNLSLNNVNEYPFAKWPANTIIPVDGNTLLIGTTGGGGIYRTDADFRVKEHYLFGSMDYDWIWTWYRQGDSIFIATQKGNLIYYVKTKKLKKLLRPPFDQFFPIFSFVPGKDSSIWMSRYINDFLNYQPRTDQYKKYSLSQMGEIPTVLRLAKDREENVWLLSSLGGVLKFDDKKERIVERLPVDKKNGLLDTHIFFVLDLNEDLLIGYIDDGISLYNKKTKTFRHFNRSDGLVSNSVTDALQTDKNTVWITSGNGISCFDLSTYTFVNYGYDNGILQNNFTCIAQLPDGRLAAGNIRGLIYFWPDAIHTSGQVTAPVITSINVYGHNLPVDSFINGNPLKISYDRNYFSFDYISLQYQNNQQIEYAYRLQGFDKNWINAGNRRFVSYSNLNGGNYVFMVRSRTPGNAWVECRYPLAIYVDTPYYKKWWFIPLCALAFISIVYGLFRYRVKQLLRVEKMRASISSDLHDEVGASLSSISIFSEMARQSLSSKGKAEQYLQRIGDRSRDSIEKMSDIIWSINPENDSMQQMLTRMKTFANEIVEGKEIELHWKESEIVSDLSLGMAQRKNFYLLFKEAIINAVKYSGAKNILIELSAHNRLVSLKVIDDGKGFAFDSVRQGNGIKNMQQRAVLLNGTVTVASAAGKGTTVHLQFRHA